MSEAGVTPMPGTIYTFYSYKGGVGRSMALVNVGVLLALAGKRVLLVDWDLEAPGLELFFEKATNLQGDPRSVPGIVDLLEARILGRDLSWRKCLLKAEFLGTSLDIISAGRRSADYRKRLQQIDWEVLYREHNVGNWIDELREEWRSPNNYDLVLIDSRTGITDIGDICTILLPDAIVLMFVTNHQNVVGIRSAMARAVKARKGLPVNRNKLLGIPLASRDEVYNEYEKSLEWRKIFATEFADFYRDWLPREVTPEDALNKLFIPYVTNWSFGERIPVLESARETQDPTTIGAAYKRVANLLANRLDWYSLESTIPFEELQSTQLQLMRERARATALQEAQLARLEEQAKMLAEEAEARLREQADLFEEKHRRTLLEEERRVAREHRKYTFTITAVAIVMFFALVIWSWTWYGRRDPIKELVTLGWTIQSGSGGASLKYSGQPPFEKSVNFLRQVRASRISISNVSYIYGIESWAQLDSLSELELSGNIRDLSALSDLRQLSTLSLRNTKVNDLRPLQGLERLSELDLSNTQVIDLSPLYSLKNLLILNVSRTPLIDLRPLQDLRNLSSLDLSETRIHDLSPLIGLEGLHVLRLSDMEIKDLSPLGRLWGLEILDLSYTDFVDLSALRALKGLSQLDVRGTKVSLNMRVSDPTIDWLRRDNKTLTVIF